MAIIHVQTRVIVQNKSEIESNLKTAGFQKQKTLNIHDSYYTNSTDFDPELHTYEKTGESVRIRRTDGNIGVERQRAMTKKDKSHHTHDAVEYETLYEGNEKDAVDAVYKLGYLFHLIDIEKTRVVYARDTDAVFLDSYTPQVTIIEIDSVTESPKEYEKIKKKHLKVLKDLDISQTSIISDGYIHRRITALIESDPTLKREMLEKDLKYLIKVLRDKELASGEAYTDTGDGWHENPTYETIYHDMLLLNQRIIDVKEQLANL